MEVSETTDFRTRPSGSPERQARMPRGSAVGIARPETRGNIPRTINSRRGPWEKPSEPASTVTVRSAKEGERRLVSHPIRRRGTRAKNSGCDVHKEFLPEVDGVDSYSADQVPRVNGPHQLGPKSKRGCPRVQLGRARVRKNGKGGGR